MVITTIILDAGPLGLVTNPKMSNLSLQCAQWLNDLVMNGHRVIVPEIADYEVRRELLRAQKLRGLKRLDELIGTLEYLPITTEAMREAAILWAKVRNEGNPTADDKALDGDVILAAQAKMLRTERFLIATTNVRHLVRLAPSVLWTDYTSLG